MYLGARWWGPQKSQRVKRVTNQNSQLRKMADVHRPRIYVSSGDENSGPHDWVASAVTYWTRSQLPLKTEKEENEGKYVGAYEFLFFFTPTDLWCDKVFLNWINDIL